VVAKVASNFRIESDPEDEEEEDLDLSDDELRRTVPERPSLPYSQLPTGVCYDSRMRFHIELDPPKDRSDYHPEDPRRILWIFRTLCEAGLISKKDSELAVEPIVGQPLRMLPARLATSREVCLVHTEEHFLFVQGTASKSQSL
jgi:histone deacetylase 6